MNKKGIFSIELILWFLRILVVVILIFSIQLMIRKYIVVKVDVANSENLLLVTFLQKTPAFHKVDEITGLTSRGIIDLNNFQSPRIEDILNDYIYLGPNQRQLSANITLYDHQGKFKHEIIYNKDLYKDLKIESIAGGIWGKTLKIYRYNQPVILKQGNKMSNGQMMIEVLKE